MTTNPANNHEDGSRPDYADRQQLSADTNPATALPVLVLLLLWKLSTAQEAIDSLKRELVLTRNESMDMREVVRTCSDRVNYLEAALGRREDR